MRSETGTDVPDGWRAVRGDETIQFVPVDPPPQPEQPQWLRDFLEWLANAIEPLGQMFGNAWPVVKWVLVALAVAGALFLIWRMVEPLLDRPGGNGEQEPEWAPQCAAALALLEDADRLAAEGKYDEATHLLLQRSVGQIAAARPEWVAPSSTARELSSLPALPAAARQAFAVIATRVESSVFALRRLGRDDWQAARDAYAEFALQQLPARIR
jgi:hypothetical protein